jgi:hypothetical protein
LSTGRGPSSKLPTRVKYVNLREEVNVVAFDVVVHTDAHTYTQGEDTVKQLCTVLAVLVFTAAVVAGFLHGFNMQYAIDGIEFKSAERRLVEAEVEQEFLPWEQRRSAKEAQ